MWLLMQIAKAKLESLTSLMLSALWLKRMGSYVHLTSGANERGRIRGKKRDAFATSGLSKVAVLMRWFCIR